MTPMNPHSSLPSNPGLPFSRQEARKRLFACCLLAVLSGMALADGLCPGEQGRAAGMRQRIVHEWPLRPAGDEATEFVQALAVRLAGQYSPGAAKIPWRFGLARNLAPNAFSIGAGNVFVTEGAVTFAQNEEELATILAHEMGHELAGHFCDQPYAGGSGDGFSGLFTSPPVLERQEVAGLGSLRQTVEPLKEQQADQIAVSILRAAGYDPHALLQVTRRLRSGGEGHWFDQRRIQSLERLLAGIPSGLAGPRDSERFHEIKRILLDEAPHQ